MPSTYRIIHDRLGADITYLAVEPEKADSETRLVLCLHGLHSDKESMLETAYRFARRGFRAVAVELALHGEREGAATRAKGLETGYTATMTRIIEGSVADIVALLDHFGSGRVGVHGLSMGGVVAFAAVLADPRLATASIAMGSPDWVGILESMGVPPDHPQMVEIRQASPLSRAAGFAPRPLLMLHGDLDETVPIDGVLHLHEKLTPLYSEEPDRLDLVVYEGVAHTYLDDMIDRSIDWHDRWL